MGNYNTIVSLSGGMDSATLLAKIISERGGVRGICREEAKGILCVGFNYGSKHAKFEISKAAELVQQYCVDYRILDVRSVFEGFQSNLMQENPDPIPDGHYNEANMSLTVVPGRNIIFASILAGLAMSEGAKSVYLGIHQGDHFIYPDCRPEFFLAMQEAIEAGTDRKVTLIAPFMKMNKISILKLGLSLGVPYSCTRTCYKAQLTACGLCGSCQERLEAFVMNNAVDPIPYYSRELIPKKG